MYIGISVSLSPYIHVYKMYIIHIICVYITTFNEQRVHGFEREKESIYLRTWKRKIMYNLNINYCNKRSSLIPR